MRPFFSIVTRHLFTRPALFARLKESLDGQDCKDFEHIVIEDGVAHGIAWANRQFWQHRGLVGGEYVLLLDDDDRLAFNGAIGGLKQFIEDNGYPDIVVFRDRRGPAGVLPSERVWIERVPRIGEISGQGFVVRNPFWQKHIGAFGTGYAGDYEFMVAMWGDNPTVAWMDTLITESDWQGQGRAEEASNVTRSVY